MGTLLTVIGAIVIGVLVGLIRDEANAWFPTIIAWITKLAVVNMPKHLQARCEEEWPSVLNDTPGQLLKCGKAIGFLITAYKLELSKTYPTRLFDIAVATIGLFLLAPLLTILAVIALWEQNGAILESKNIRGQHNRLVRLWLIKLHNDPFLFGRLPFLFNIAKGDLSFVGPRPLGPEAIELIGPELMLRRMSVKPGLCSPAFAKGGGFRLTLQEEIAFDLWYVENRNFWIDLKIFVACVGFSTLTDRKNK